MVRLTHWVEDKTKGEFTNVISGRVIRKEEWAKRNTSFVKLTKADGYSKTIDFYRTATGSLAAQLGAMSLSTPTTQASGSTQGKASGSSATSRPSPPAGSTTVTTGQPAAGGPPPQDPTSTPAPRRTQDLPPGAPKSNRNMSPSGSGARNEQSSPGPSRSTAASPATRPVTATLNGRKYPVTLRDGQPISITVGKNNVLNVSRSTSGQGFVVEDKGQKVPITLGQ